MQITSWHKGFKLGEFSKTRKRALFRAKALTKKKKVKTEVVKHKQVLQELKIDNIKLIKSGQKKKQRNILMDDDLQFITITF